MRSDLPKLILRQRAYGLKAQAPGTKVSTELVHRVIGQSPQRICYHASFC
jgi:hypothetical protein